jgi:hypothetical protein
MEAQNAEHYEFDPATIPVRLQNRAFDFAEAVHFPDTISTCFCLHISCQPTQILVNDYAAAVWTIAAARLHRLR